MVQFLSSKGALIRFPVDMHIYMVCPSKLQSFTKFCWAVSEKLRWQTFSSIFHFNQISKFKKGVTPKKKLNQNFLWICISTHYFFHYYNVSRNSVERFQRSCYSLLSTLRGDVVHHLKKLRNLNLLRPRMLCAKFGQNWHWSAGEKKLNILYFP